MTATTTWAAIRANQATLVKSLTPAQHSREKFREFEYSEDFDEWSQKNPSAAFRRFEVVDAPQFEPADAHTFDVRSVSGGTLVRVAYPHQFALYGRQNMSSLRELADEDARKIGDTLELLSNYVAGQQVQLVADIVLQDFEKVSVLEIEFQLKYYRSNAA